MRETSWHHSDGGPMASGPSQPKPQIIEDDMVPPGTMYALNFNSMKAEPIPDAKEYEHDRRLRGQYE